MNEHTSAAALAQARADLYAFLAGNWLEDPVSLDQIRPDLLVRWLAVAETVDSVNGAVIIEFLATDDGSLVSSLGQEYQNLLRVPAGRYVVPIQSVYEGARKDGNSWAFGLKRGPARAAALKRYRTAGFQPLGGMEPDHLGCQLAFLSTLCSLEGTSDTQVLRQQYHRWQTEALSAFMQPWMDTLGAHVEFAARLPYYPAAFAVLRTFLAAEVDYLSVLTDGAPIEPQMPTKALPESPDELQQRVN